MPVPPSPLLDETITPGQSGHIADHDAIHDALNNDLERVYTPAAATAAAIQTAIDLAHTDGGGTVFCAPATYLGGLTTIPGQSYYAAMIWMRSNVKLRFAKGAVLKLQDNAALPGGTTQGLLIGTYSAASQTGVVVEDVVCDGNAANNQGSGVIIGAGIHFHSALFPTATRCKVFNVYGTLPGPPGETFHFDATQCVGASFVNCEADGGGVDSATGFSTNDSFGTSWTNCIAHDMEHGQGFTAWQSGGLRYANCHAYSCPGANGFNLERCEGVTYAACVAGGRTPLTASSPDVPGYSDNTDVGCENGFVSSGNIDVTYSACQASYNVVGFQAVPNTAASPTLDNKHVHFSGVLNDNTANVTIDSTQDSVYVENWADSGSAFGHRTSAVAPLHNAIALNGGSGFRQGVSGYSSYVYRLEADGFNVFTVVGGTDPSGGGTDQTAQAGNAVFPFNVAADAITTKYLSGAGLATIAASDFAHRPGDGSLAVVKDTTSGIVRLFAKAGGTWLGVAGADATDTYKGTSFLSPSGTAASFGSKGANSANILTNNTIRMAFSGSGGIGVFSQVGSPVTQPTVSGSRGGNAAVASLLTALASLGWVVDGSSA